MVLGWTIRVRVQSRQWATTLPAVAGSGLALAQSRQGWGSGSRSTAGCLGRLLAWAGMLAMASLLTVGVWWLLPSYLPISFALRLH